jgi:hypothetical protein
MSGASQDEVSLLESVSLIIVKYSGKNTEATILEL